MSDGIVVEGEAELNRTLRTAADALGDLTPANQKAAQALLERADPRTPRDGGALASSGGVVADSEGGTVTYDEVYAGVIHNGWPDHNIDAQPWLADAAVDGRADLIDVYVDHITDVVHHVHGI